MTKEILNLTERLNRLYDSHKDTVTDVLYEKITDYDNEPKDIARGIVYAIRNCDTAHEYELVNGVISAITGWDINGLLEIVEDRIKEGEV